MFSSVLARRCWAAGVLLALAAPAWGNPALTDKQAEEARQLVRQLGAADFRSRERAADKLVRMGSAVEPILREGLAYPDAEVRFRCRTILPQAISYDLEKRLQVFLSGKDAKDQAAPASWTKFKSIVGDTPKSRELFASMHRYDTQFLNDLEKNPSSLQQKMNTRCMDLMYSQNTGNQNALVPPEQLALLLFAAQEPKVKPEANSLQFLSSALHSLSYKRGGKDLLKNNDLIRTLLVKYITEGTSYTSYNNLYLVANLELKEGADIAKSLLKNSEHDPYTRGMAISILGKLGGRSAIPEVIPFLTDKQGLGETQFPNNVRIKTQIRDVALATLLQITGQSLA
jgi:hypothetical protein